MTFFLCRYQGKKENEQREQKEGTYPHYKKQQED